MKKTFKKLKKKRAGKPVYQSTDEKGKKKEFTLYDIQSELADLAVQETEVILNKTIIDNDIEEIKKL